MKYTVHRLLAMVKTTVDRLNDEIGGEYISVKAKGLSDEKKRKIESDIVRRYNKVNALLRNLEAIKLAIAKHNAGITEHTVGIATQSFLGKDLTLTEILSLDEVFTYKQQLLGEYKSSLAKANKEEEKITQQAENELNKFLTALAGGDKKQLSSSQIEEYTVSFLKTNRPTIIDPCDIRKQIEELEKEIANYEVDKNTALSVGNAIATIDLDLAE